MTEFIQWVNSKRVYHLDLESLDGSDFPVITKPVWTLTHQNADGSPSPCIGMLETPPDCHMGRITAGPDPGTITVTVTAVISPTAVATQTFKINVMRIHRCQGVRRRSGSLNIGMARCIIKETGNAKAIGNRGGPHCFRRHGMAGRDHRHRETV